jgi:hypothetical protein
VALTVCTDGLEDESARDPTRCASLDDLGWADMPCEAPDGSRETGLAVGPAAERTPAEHHAGTGQWIDQLRPELGSAFTDALAHFDRHLDGILGNCERHTTSRVGHGCTAPAA